MDQALDAKGLQLQVNQDKIHFYRQGDPNGCFSNFYFSPITINNKQWPTTEHYFQAIKFDNVDYQEQIRNAKTPSEAKKLGQTRSYPLRKDWEEVKDQIMYTALEAKFTQYEQLKKFLISTGNSYIAEHTSNDKYWGDGLDGSGKNILGQLLMKLRDNINKKK